MRGAPDIVLTPAPDLFEPIVAWRLWYAVETGSGFRLSSIFHSTVWPTDKGLAAACGRVHIPLLSSWRRDRHDAPLTTCNCGIYGAPLERLAGYLKEASGARGVPVLGQVSLWGTVIECEHGWRASDAYPLSLHVPSVRGDAGYLARVVYDLAAYHVPLQVLSSSSVRDAIDEVSVFAALA